MDYVLRCTRCGYILSTISKHTICPLCQGVLFVKIPSKAELDTDWIHVRDPSMWRYGEILPPVSKFRITLGEGFTPILTLEKNLLLKDEGQNPTGTFKARGISLAISMAKQLGISHIGLATAGNAGGATALYASTAGIKATIVMPQSAPLVNQQEVLIAGAHLELVEGTIADAGEHLNSLCEKDPLIFPISTMKEPYRVEGKKTIGYEIWEQLDNLPLNVVYPTGGGTGLVGIWKAFNELLQLGFLDEIPTRMFAVQSSGCAPIVQAWKSGKEVSEVWENPRTMATGLCVPKAYGDYLILRVIRESKGGAVAVTDSAIQQAMHELGRVGIIASPEGAATLAGYQRLLREGILSSHNKTLLLMTGSGYKYLQGYSLKNTTN